MLTIPGFVLIALWTTHEEEEHKTEQKMIEDEQHEKCSTIHLTFLLLNIGYLGCRGSGFGQVFLLTWTKIFFSRVVTSPCAELLNISLHAPEEKKPKVSTVQL